MIKLEKNTFPVNCKPTDFKCYGPQASRDTEFSIARIADMGCFSQELVDSNKYYHVCMCTEIKTGDWYVYVEYGREGACKRQCQWFKCVDEKEARKVFEERCKEKNTSRGQWATVGGIQMFVPKPGKDLYRVRNLAKRSHGLPDAQNITVSEVVTVAVKSATRKNRCDDKTTQLVRDLLAGAVSYTRSSLQGGTIPVQSSIDEARLLLEVAKKRIAAVGDSLDEQVNDHALKQATYALYSRIPKNKKLHSKEKSWILSKDNIFDWEQDLSAFESALSAGSIDPMDGFPLDMEWIDPKSQLGQWLYKWWPAATINKYNMGTMKIKNLWKVHRHDDVTTFASELKKVAGEVGATSIAERPLHQERDRVDLIQADRQSYWQANVFLGFHGTRSVNVPGILKTNLRLPAQLTGVQINAADFGGGLYWSDDYKKAAQYTSVKNAMYVKGANGVVEGRGAFMFAADVILGVPHVPKQSFGFTAPPKGSHCVLGKAGFCYSNYLQHTLLNNEWVVYQSGRNALRYLVEFT